MIVLLVLIRGSWEFDPYVSFCVGALVELLGYILSHAILDRVGRKLPYCIFALAFGIVAMLIIPIQNFIKPEQQGAYATNLQ